jgi:uncharacterized protein YdeI (YjbR/CyaY-like superfamily)
VTARSKPTSFASAAAFRRWLEAHHRDTSELVLRLFKKHASARGLTYREALDEALCFGWIDGVIRALDGDSFAQRFTPRRRGSRWSAVNVKRAKELIAEGRMRPAGRAAFEARTGDAAGYSFEARAVALAPALERHFRANAAAWAGWEARPPWYRRTCSHWVMSAKREATRERRLLALIEASARGVSAPPLRQLDKVKPTRRAASRPRAAGARGPGEKKRR